MYSAEYAPQQGPMPINYIDILLPLPAPTPHSVHCQLPLHFPFQFPVPQNSKPYIICGEILTERTRKREARVDCCAGDSLCLQPLLRLRVEGLGFRALSSTVTTSLGHPVHRRMPSRKSYCVLVLAHANSETSERWGSQISDQKLVRRAAFLACYKVLDCRA